DPEAWQRNLKAAYAAFQRAEDALNLGESNVELRDQVAVVRVALSEDNRDCRMMEELERILEDYWSGDGPENDNPNTAQRYEKVFRDNGLPLLGLPVSEMARRLRKHRFGSQLGEAVESWAKCLAIIVNDPKPALHMKSTFYAYMPPRFDWQKCAPLLDILNA